jgi:tRNA(adenine34) deaminase
MMAFTDSDKKWMQLALEQARLCAEAGEPPIGAVLVCGEELVVAEHNHRERDFDITSHAEIEVLRAAGAKRRDWRMGDCTLYVTLEPCPMCAGALAGARIGRIVFGAKDPRAGACGSLLNLFAYPLEARPEVVSEVLSEDSLALLRDFFAKRRK